MHGLGVSEALQGVLPKTAVIAFAIITQLGDLWLFFVVLSLVYWFGERFPVVGVDRRRAAFVIALALGGFSLSVGLKSLFALPRPAGASAVARTDILSPSLHTIYRNFATATGYGFPSGHAIGATLVWGGLAMVVDRWTNHQRFAGAALLVTLVGFSRVALGVHHLSSVLVGIGVGAGYLWLAWHIAGGRFLRPSRAFALATLTGILGVIIVDPAGDIVGALVAALGGTLAWLAVGGAVDLPPHHLEGPVCAIVGLPVFGGLFALAILGEPPVVVGAVTYATVVTGVLALPLTVRPVISRVAAEPDREGDAVDGERAPVGPARRRQGEEDTR